MNDKLSRFILSREYRTSLSKISQSKTKINQRLEISSRSLAQLIRLFVGVASKRCVSWNLLKDQEPGVRVLRTWPATVTLRTRRTTYSTSLIATKWATTRGVFTKMCHHGKDSVRQALAMLPWMNLSKKNLKSLLKSSLPCFSMLASWNVECQEL